MEPMETIVLNYFGVFVFKVLAFEVFVFEVFVFEVFVFDVFVFEVFAFEVLGLRFQGLRFPNTRRWPRENFKTILLAAVPLEEIQKTTDSEVKAFQGFHFVKFCETFLVL